MYRRSARLHFTPDMTWQLEISPFVTPIAFAFDDDSFLIEVNANIWRHSVTKYVVASVE